MNKVLRRLAFATMLLILPAGVWAQGGQGGPPQGGSGRGQGQGQGFPGGPGGAGRGRGGFVPSGPAGALAGRADIYSSTNGIDAVGKPTSAGEYFFIIGSVDQAQQQILLKWPTEVTLLLKVTPNTKFVNEAGKQLKLADFRAGDTVWVKYQGSGENATAVNVRAGVMSVADLHKYFLDYAVIK
ncbi:MAG TPA: hypothetical protein VIY69_08140 [Candidatus Acidoferrales bacterium]